MPSLASPPIPTGPAFELRRREAEWLDEAQTLIDFATPAPASCFAHDAGLAEILVADAIARVHFEVGELAGGRPIITCETPRYGIPVGVHDLDAPALDDWRLRDELHGELIDRVDGRVARSLATQVRRGLIAVAGALPLLASPVLAHAAGPGAHGPSLEQLLAFAPPKLPDNPEPAPAPAPDAPAGAEGPASGEDSAAPASAAPATDTPPPPRLGGETLSLTGSSLWEGLLGKHVRLDMKNGESVAGTVVAQSISDLALARAPDGVLVAVPKAEVSGVRVRLETPAAGSAGGGGSDIPRHERPLQDGRGLNAGGIVTVTIGSIFALSGTVMLALSPYYLFISLPLLLPGLAMIGGGSAMIYKAGKKKKAFDHAWGIPTKSARLELTPTLAGGRSGGAAGLILKF